jgi:phage I-like protein
MAPVHAPAADGLTRGKPVQLLRVGPLYDLDTGAHVLDVTDDLCASIAATASAVGYSLPIDHGHSLYRAQSAGEAHDGVPLFGRIVALEHVPGAGLFGVPEWTESGRSMLSASPGLLYLSPTILGQAHDPATGAALPGRALHSVSLTPTPRQNNLETLALSRGNMEAPTMGDPTPRTPAVNPDVVTLARVDHTALLDRATGAERRVSELTAQLDAATGDTVTLAARLTAMELRDAERTANAELDAAEKSGKVIPPESRVKLLALDPGVRALTLSLIPATRPAVVAGHGGKAPEPRDESDPAVIRAAVNLSREKSIGFSEALKLAANPAAGGVQ